MTIEMTVENTHWFLDLFEELGVSVWIDGGWGVDALLGEQTRPHADIDIFISWNDSSRLVDELLARRFVDIHTDDRVDENFVMGHESHGQIDFHVFERTENGDGFYKPGVYDWAISADELAATGSIGGRTVRCFSAEYMVRSHADYKLKASDVHDLLRLRERFGVQLLDEQIRAIESID